MYRKEAYFALLSRLREPNLYKNNGIIWSKISFLWYTYAIFEISYFVGLKEMSYFKKLAKAK